MEAVSIIIPHYGADEQQERALNICTMSLHATYPQIPVIIAKNGVTKCQHPARVVIHDQGQHKAVNAAAAIVNTKWLFITNDDMVYAPGWMDKLMNTAINHKLKFLCMNLCEPRQGAPPFLTQPFGGAGGDFNESAWLAFAATHHDFTLEEGFNMPFLIDHDVWNRIGGYDVNYDPWGSNGDSDMQAKLMLGGLDTFRDRNVLVYHFSQTSGTFEPQNQEYWNKNYAYFTKKWGFDRQPTDKVWYSRDIIDSYKLIYKPEWMAKLGKDPVKSLKFFNHY